jgi:hypothetical protein
VWDAKQVQHPAVWGVDFVVLQGIACCQHHCERRVIEG